MGRKEGIDSLGGSEGGVEGVNDLRSCDKGSHLFRSLANQPNHFRHWRGHGNIAGPPLEHPDPETPGRLFAGWFWSHLPIINSRDHKGESKD